MGGWKWCDALLAVIFFVLSCSTSSGIAPYVVKNPDKFADPSGPAMYAMDGNEIDFHDPMGGQISHI